MSVPAALPLQDGMKTGRPADPAKGVNGIIIMPAFNEAHDITAVVQAVRQETSLEVLVVDDASSDQTVELARQAGARVMSLSQNLGAWGAIQAGLRYACQSGFDFAMTMDADGQPMIVRTAPIPMTKE